MKLNKVYIITMLLAANSTLSASLFKLWPFISEQELCARDLKSAAEEFKIRQIARVQCGLELKDAANDFKKRHDIEVKEREKESDRILAEEISKPQLSWFFTNSKPSLSLVGIFNTSLVKKLGCYYYDEFVQQSCITRINEQRIRGILDHDETYICGECPESSQQKLSDKKTNRFYFYFKCKRESNGIPVYQLSLIERILGTTHKQNVTLHSIIGTGTTPIFGKKHINDNNSLIANYFTWKKIDPIQTGIDDLK